MILFRSQDQWVVLLILGTLIRNAPKTAPQFTINVHCAKGEFILKLSS